MLVQEKRMMISKDVRIICVCGRATS